MAKLPRAERHAKLLEGAKKEGEINWLNGIGGAHGRTWGEMFNKRYAPLKAIRNAQGSSDSSEIFYTENLAGKAFHDMGGGSIPDMKRSLDKGFLAVYPTPAIEDVLPKYMGFQDPEHHWIAYVWQEHGIAYNPELLKGADVPKDWWDACDPKFKRQASFDPAEPRFLNGLAVMMGEEKVREWLICVSKNEPIIMRGHTTRLMLMMAGDHALTFDQYLYQGTMLNEKNPKKAPFKAVYGAPVLAYASGSIISKQTKNPHMAALLSDWQLGQESQEMLAEGYRNPVGAKNPYQPAEVQLIPFGIVDDAITERLVGYWNSSIGPRR